MKIIPVIDLKAGQVVHAVRGMRNCYQPIQLFSQITQSSEPALVIEDLLRLYPFDNCYIADLDAICGEASQKILIDHLQEQFPRIEFWLDNGAQLSQIENIQTRRKTVIGTESQRLPPYPIKQEYVLSLDFNSQALGISSWFSEHQYWPATVIVMTLAQVGSNNGPDWQKLSELLDKHPDKKFIAAGGIRHGEDLQRLDDMGLTGALVATALHSGAIEGAQIAEFQAKKYPGKPRYF